MLFQLYLVLGDWDLCMVSNFPWRAGFKMNSGEGELDSWAHGTAQDVAYECGAMVDLQGEMGRGTAVRGRKTEQLHPQGKKESGGCFTNHRVWGATSRECGFNSFEFICLQLATLTGTHTPDLACSYSNG